MPGNDDENIEEVVAEGLSEAGSVEDDVEMVEMESEEESADITHAGGEEENVDDVETWDFEEYDEVRIRTLVKLIPLLKLCI